MWIYAGIFKTQSSCRRLKIKRDNQKPKSETFQAITIIFAFPRSFRSLQNRLVDSILSSRVENFISRSISRTDTRCGTFCPREARPSLSLSLNIY